jgi:large subunit ribosomal protein L7/L12
MAQRLVVQRLSLALARHGRHGCCVMTTTMMTSRSPLVSSSFAWIHSTRIVLEKKPDDNDNDDECPDWQNPLHHNNPELEKTFPEDFKEGEEMPLVPLPPLASEEGSNVLAPTHIHELANEILLLNMMEMKQLMDKLAIHFGFDPHTVAMGLAGGGGGGGAASSSTRTTTEEQDKIEEKKTIFDLKLIAFDAKSKIKVIKEVRAIAGLGLKEAKELVEGAPTIIKKDLKQEEAEEFQKKLQEVGATMEIV